MENINYLNDFQISLIEILNELKSDKQSIKDFSSRCLQNDYKTEMFGEESKYFQQLIK